MKAWTLGLALATFSAAPIVSLACGVCDEDKIAATYDHAVVHRAAADGEVMVYCEISGSLDAERVKAVLARVPGIRLDSVRIAAWPAALSFALDPKVQLPDTAILAAQRELSPEMRLRRVSFQSDETPDDN